MRLLLRLSMDSWLSWWLKQLESLAPLLIEAGDKFGTGSDESPWSSLKSNLGDNMMVVVVVVVGVFGGFVFMAADAHEKPCCNNVIVQ
jgi:hypothetical protein